MESLLWSPPPALLPPPLPVAVDGRERVALASPVIFGNKGTPAMRACASACMMRATATAMSRLEVWAS